MLLQRQRSVSPLFLQRRSRHVLLIGLHIVAAGGVSGSSSSCGVFSPELGGIAGLSGPRYCLWKEEVSCSGNESTVGCEVYEHNNE